MEHRYYPRIETQHRLLIHVGQSSFVNGVIKNISNGGLALEAPDIAVLKKNGLVRAAFVVNGALVILRSQVVRVANHEAALMFSDETSPRKRLLKDWLNSAVRAGAGFAAEVNSDSGLAVPSNAGCLQSR